MELIDKIAVIIALPIFFVIGYLFSYIPRKIEEKQKNDEAEYKKREGLRIIKLKEFITNNAWDADALYKASSGDKLYYLEYRTENLLNFMNRLSYELNLQRDKRLSYELNLQMEKTDDKRRNYKRF